MVNNLKVGIIPNFTREKALDVTKNTIAELEKLNIDYHKVSVYPWENAKEELEELNEYDA